METNTLIIPKNRSLVIFNVQNDWKPYRLKTKMVGLTYSRFPVLKEKFIQLLKEKINLFNSKNKNKINVIYDISCNDYHMDSGLHIHALLVFDKKIQLRDAQKVFALPFINYQGKEEYRTACFEKPKQKFGNHLDRFRAYIIKKGNFIENGIYPKKSRKQDEREKKNELDIERLRLEVLFKSGLIDPVEAEKQLKSFGYKLDNVLYWDKLRDLALKMSKDTFVFELLEETEIYDFDSYLFEPFNMVEKMVLKLMNSGVRKKSLFIVGGTGIGKTRMIKTILRKLGLKYSYIKGKIDFSPKKFDDSRPVVIMDDITLQKIYKLDPEDGFKNFIGNGDTTEVDVKMQKTATITGGKLFIYIVNPDKHPEKWCVKNDEFEKYDHIYIRKNIEVIEFDKEKYNDKRPLFYTDEEKKYRQKLKGVNGRSSEVLARLMFGDGKVEVIEK
ncbi:geminivirus Rep catalytic domain protein [Candidatus Phytoplasma oryzae]|uniref:Geminivirus Rep catalytic domain protein n=1 Tax=Candidatus Phytoplasma oryzae TaxID=203274 RepID=A0A139JQ75_9MOLU|nr:hypothetical protein [Candidatus Phytoplasma oryzae]KXT29014.1 geminivirus Rep catalytic domain protein [Candidatus Phytoplasma oryzae]